MKSWISGLNLDLKSWIPGLKQTRNWEAEFQVYWDSLRKKVENLDLTAKPCSKQKTNNQQLLRNKLKLKLKYGVNLRFETQIWKPGADLELKNLEMRSQIPGLNLEKNRLKPGKDRFLVYFKKSTVSLITTNIFTEFMMSMENKTANGSNFSVFSILWLDLAD